MIKKNFSDDEIKQILDYLIARSRTISGYNRQTNPHVCLECQHIIGNLCYNEFRNNNLLFEEANLNIFGIENLTHYFSFVGFNTTNGNIWFMVDPTFSQFNTENFVLDNRTKTNTTILYNQNFGKILDTNGYVLLTDEILRNYIDGFIKSLNITDIDKIEKIYQKVNDYIGLLNIEFYNKESKNFKIN